MLYTSRSGMYAEHFVRGGGGFIGLYYGLTHFT